MTAMTALERQYYVWLGQRMRAARQQAGLSQRQLARYLELHAGVTISYWERALNRPSVWYLHRLDAIFGAEWRS